MKRLLILLLFPLTMFSQDWIQLGQDIDGESAEDFSGWQVALNDDGDILAIGAMDNDGVNGEQSGHVRVYEWDGSSWNQVGDDIDGEAEGDESGYVMSLNSSGSIVAIGARHNDGNGSNSGHVRVYEWDGNSWNQLGDDIDGEAEGDQFGFSLSINSSGDILAIGGEGNDDNGIGSGHVRVYEWDGENWNQLGSDIDGEASGDSFGYDVSINNDGNIIAVGAIGNDANFTPTPASGVGHVRVFEWDGLNWNQLGQDIDGESPGDISGFSVSVNGLGNIVLIGAKYNDANGEQSGHARVYEWDGENWNQLGDDINGEAPG